MSRKLKSEIWRWPLYLLIAVGVAASLLVGMQRMALEAGSKTTLLSLEWGQLKDTAARNGSTVEQALAQLLKDENGRPLISGVVYKEPMLIDWQNGGYLQLVTGAQLLNDVRVGGWEVAEASEEAEDAEDALLLDNNHNYVLCYDEAQQQLVLIIWNIKPRRRTAYTRWLTLMRKCFMWFPPPIPIRIYRRWALASARRIRL